MKSRTILIVDDEVASVRHLERALAFAGCDDHPSTTDPRRVFALCAVMVVVLLIAGKLWMEPKPLPAQQQA